MDSYTDRYGGIYKTYNPNSNAQRFLAISIFKPHNVMLFYVPLAVPANPLKKKKKKKTKSNHQEE